MFQKMIAALAALTVAAGVAGVLAESAAPREEVFTLSGLVLQVAQESVLLDCGERGEYQVNLHEGTAFEGVEDAAALRAGQYILVRYDGKETRSLPPQVSASHIACHALTGVVTQTLEEGFLLETRDEQDGRAGEALVHPGACQTPEPGARVTVYFSGVMTLSLPGQITALHIAPGDTAPAATPGE